MSLLAAGLELRFQGSPCLPGAWRTWCNQTPRLTEALKCFGMPVNNRTAGEAGRLRVPVET